MKPKLLILYNKLLHYRIPIFRLLAEKYDLTVAYNYGNQPDTPLNFKTIKLNPYKIWKFTSQHDKIFSLANQFDVVLTYGETAYIKYSLLSLRKKRNFKLIYWSIGAPASYTRKYGEASKLYFTLTDFFTRRADAQISYAEQGRKLHIQRGFNPEKLFVANNTVEVCNIPRERERNSIMFIGTLYPQKGLPILLEAYKAAYLHNKDIVPLEIVGDGILKEDILKWISENSLSEKIHLHGALYKNEEKAEVFSHALACISPNQAGLGVLESMGYGVPFITHKDAITGGEAFNIQNDITGLRLETLDALSDVILDISTNPNKYKEMGERAFDYFWDCRKPEDMANGLSEAIDYVLTH